MTCHIAHRHTNTSVTELGKFYEIIVVSAGFITVDTLPGYIETRNFRGFPLSGIFRAFATVVLLNQPVRSDFFACETAKARKASRNSASTPGPVRTALPFLASLDKPEAKDFVARQKKMFDEDTVVTWATCSHYGLVKLLANAIEKSGGLDKEKIIDTMGDQTITVGNGPETMRGSDHHVVLNMLIGEFTGGKLEVKKDLGKIEPSDQCAGKKM